MKTSTLAILLALALHAQPPSATPVVFEVVSIKPHPEPVTYSGRSTSGTRATWTATTLIDLIVGGYALKYYQVLGGPPWAGSSCFDIDARTGGNTPPDRNQFQQMVQTLLAERFHLRVHREMKEMPVYALVVGKTGAKLKEPDMTSSQGGTVAGLAGVHITKSHGTMEQLAEQLSGAAGRPVLDKTGLTGMYAYKLDFNSSTGITTSDSDVPSMPTALQEQLGLRLEPAKAQIEILVIDSAEKPSAN